MKTAKQIAIWHGLDNHPELEDCIKAMEEYKAQSVAELVERLADAKYIIKIMYDKIPLEQTTARMSTIVSEIAILLDKIENEKSSAAAGC